MIQRYQSEVMRRLWSDKHKFNQFLKVELAASKAWMKLGLFDEQTYLKLCQAEFKLKEIEDFEKETRHDVIAFTKAATLHLGEEKKWFHYGLTSTDIVDTAQSLVLKDVNKMIKRDINHFMGVLKEKAFIYRDLPTIGRTHGIHAEITSFGLKFALWYEDFKRILKRFKEASKDVETCKLSGAVGNYSANTPYLQDMVAKDLGLSSSMIATQTLQRDRHANYLSVLSQIGSELEKVAVEIRHLSRTEVGEVSEYFASNQKGSSAMPHKKNPISSENISGLSRVIRGYMVSAYENIALWHERDISHSSVERIILADSTTLIDYMLKRYAHTLTHLQVNEQRIQDNIQLTYGAVHTQSVLNELIKHDMDRHEAYDIVQKLAFTAMNDKTSFEELLLNHPRVNELVDKHKITQIFKTQSYLRYVDDIYLKVFK